MHDGWGHSDIEKGNAIFAGTTENMDKLGKDGHLRYISAHGLNVGLNDGLMGNSEVGYVIYPFHYVSIESALSIESLIFVPWSPQSTIHSHFALDLLDDKSSQHWCGAHRLAGYRSD